MTLELNISCCTLQFVKSVTVQYPVFRLEAQSSKTSRIQALHDSVGGGSIVETAVRVAPQKILLILLRNWEG